MIKKFFLKQMLKRQGVPEHQQEQVLSMFEKNPELLTKIAKEVEGRVKNGEKQQIAMMEVVKKYEKELRKLQ